MTGCSAIRRGAAARLDAEGKDRRKAVQGEKPPKAPKGGK